MKKRNCDLVLLGLTVLLLAGCGKSTAASQPDTGKEAAQEIIQEEPETAAEEESEAVTAEEDQKEETVRSETAVIPLFVDYAYESVYDENTYEQRISTSIPRVLVLDDQHELLGKTFDTWNQEIYDDQMTEYTTAKDDWEEAWDSGSSMKDLTIEGSITFFRTDEKLVSLYYDEYLWLGGAHPAEYGKTLTVDPVTGNRLTLADIAEDYDILYDEIAGILSERKEEYGLFDDYVETLNRIFYDENSSYGEPVFTVSAEEVTVYFNTYLLAPYAAGAQQLHFPFSEYADLFKDEYQKKQKDSAVPVQEGEKIQIDLSLDGSEKEFYYTADRDEDGYASSFIIGYDGKLYDTADLNKTDEYFSSFQSYGYVIHRGDGRYFLYLQSFGEGDFAYLQVFEITEDGPVPVGTEGLSMNEQERWEMDPESFLMSSRFDILGTYSAFKTFHMREDGMPETEDTLWTITAAYTDWKVELTSAVDLQLTVREKDAERGNGQEETVPSGTTFLLIRTDGINYVEAALPDGRICEFTLEAPKEDTWIWKLNGMDVEDCFTYIPYAG